MGLDARIPHSVVAPFLSVLLLLTACAGGDSDAGDAKPARESPRALVARWVAKGDCGLMTARFVLVGYDSVAEGRRACQALADKTPVQPYRVQESERRGHEARVVLAVDDGSRLTFWLIPHGARSWRIDGYEERAPGDASAFAADVIAAFERETGERLGRMAELSGGTYETIGFRELLDVGSGPGDLSERSGALLERFGPFNILVAYSAKDAKRIIRGAGPDRRGIHWRRGRGLWSAEKRYENLVLVWTGSRAKRTDRGFDRLDGILRRAVESAG